jgi:hypothetical protein
MNLTERYSEVKLFNTIGGQLISVSLDSLALQMDLIQEEYLELVEAFDNKDDIEYTDAICDLFVTVAGLMQKLEACGFDVSGALKKVNENNLAKYVQYDVRKDVMEFAPANTFPIIDDVHNVIIFKDKETGKIRKPTNFVPVNLEGFEVAGFLSGNKGGV